MNQCEIETNFARKINSILTVSDFDFKVFAIFLPVSHSFVEVFNIHTKDVISFMKVVIPYPPIAARDTADRYRDAADRMRDSSRSCHAFL